MSAHRNRPEELEARLDHAIDALNAERPPVIFRDDDPELVSLVDTARVVRRLRDPSLPEAEFPARLAEHLSAELADPAFRRGLDNGRVMMAEQSTKARRSRTRLLLLPIAAMLRVIAIGVMAGMFAGLIAGGIGGRLVMRISAILYTREHPLAVEITDSSGRRVGEFTISGTIELLVQGMIIGMIGGLFYVIVRPWLPRLRGWRRGLVFGGLLLTIAGAAIFEADNADFHRFGPPEVNILMFAALALLFGLIVAPVAERLDRSLPPLAFGKSRRLRANGASIVMTAAGVLGLPVILAALGLGVTLLVTTILSAIGVGAGAQQPGVASVIVGFFIFLLAAALPLARLLLSQTSRQMASRMQGRFARPAALLTHRRAPRVAYLMLMLAVLIGSVLTLQSILTILSANN